MAIAYKSLSVNSLLDNNLTRQTIFNLNHCSEVSQLLAYPIKMAPEKPSGHMNGFKGVADLSLDVIDANDKRGKVHLIAIRPPGKLDWVSQYLKITIDGKDFIVENISNPRLFIIAFVF